MDKPTFYEQQFNILSAEWAFTQESIRSLDDIVFRIRGWAITLSSGASGYAYLNKDEFLSLYLIMPTLIFWLLDGLFKSFQRKFIARDREIRDYLSSNDFASDYQDDKITRIAITKAFATKPTRHGWTVNGFKNQFAAMFLRNVIFSYLPIVTLQLVTYWLLTKS